MDEPEPLPKITLLSSSTNVEQYRLFENSKDKEKIANFVQERFTERYITPLRAHRAIKHGFCTMAISCLLIEALESFWQGWPNTNRKSKDAFCAFFQRCVKQDSVLAVFHSYAIDFYSNVRCGILHQAESTNGWRIRRDGELLDINSKTINATKFHDALEKSLQLYCDELKQSNWDDDIWKNLRKKMDNVIKNCKV